MLAKRSVQLAFSAVIFLIAGWLLSRVWQPTQPYGASTDEGRTASDASIRNSGSPPRAGRAEPVPSSISLPVENAPLTVTFQDLTRLSEAGDANASIRLFRDLNLCAYRESWQDNLRIIDRSPGETEAEYAGNIEQRLQANSPWLERALKRLDGTDKLCEGVDMDTILGRSRYLRQAALQNDPEAMICYAISYEFGPPYLSDAWFDYVATWKQEAPRIAQKALDAGLPGILAPLINAYLQDDPGTSKLYTLDQLIGPNPQSAYTLLLVYTRLAHGADLQNAQNQMAALSGKLPSDQLADARAMSDVLWPRFQEASAAGAPLTPCGEFTSLLIGTDWEDR